MWPADFKYIFVAVKHHIPWGPFHIRSTRVYYIRLWANPGTRYSQPKSRGFHVHNYRDMGIKRMKDERGIHTCTMISPGCQKTCCGMAKEGTVHQPPSQLVGGGTNFRYHRVKWDMAEGRNYIYHNVGVPLVNFLCVGYRKIYLGVETASWVGCSIHPHRLLGKRE